jgi:hypothetical protein
MLDSEPMPDLIKFVAGQWAVGASLTTLFAAMILLTDAWGLGTLVRSDASPVFAATIFILFGVVLLAPLVVGTAIFLASSGPDARD